MELAIAEASTKGQIVIPSPLRKDIHSGDEFLIVKDNGRLIMKNMKTLAQKFKKDLTFAGRVEKAWQEYDNGKFKTKAKNDFLKELKAC